MLDAVSISLRTEELSARLVELTEWRVTRDSGVVAFHKGVLRVLDHLQYLKRVRLDFVRLLRSAPQESRRAVLRVHRELLDEGLNLLGSFMMRINIKTAHELSPAVARQVETRRREAIANLRAVRTLTRHAMSQVDRQLLPLTDDHPTLPLVPPAQQRGAKIIPLFVRS